MDTDLAEKKKLLAEYDIKSELKTMKEAREAIVRLAQERSPLARLKLVGTEQELSTAEATVALDVLSQTDEKGKPAGNAETRKAQITSALGINANYQIALEAKASVQMRIDDIDRDIASEERRYTAAKLSLAHKTAALRLLGGDA